MLCAQRSWCLIVLAAAAGGCLQPPQSPAPAPEAAAVSAPARRQPPAEVSPPSAAAARLDAARARCPVPVQPDLAEEPEQIEPDIRSTGFFRNKSKSVVGAAQKIVRDFGGEVPCDMDQLLTLPGVARKTANVVLGTWFKKNEGVVVDTHVYRISRRLELTRHDDPKKIEQDLMKIVPREKWTDFSHQVIWHGRKLCIARSPKCTDCLLENICHAADKTWSTVEVHKSAKP